MCRFISALALEAQTRRSPNLQYNSYTQSRLIMAALQNLTERES